MKIRSKGINENETFCCSKKSLNAFFANHDILINFTGIGGRHFEMNPKYYRGPKYMGKIIASLTISNENSRLGSEDGWLNFYVIRSENFSTKLQEEFEKTVLPRLYAFYISYKNKIHGGYGRCHYFRVELLNNCYVLHEGTEY